MEISITTYPQLRNNYILLNYLNDTQIKQFKSFLDEIRNHNKSQSIYLIRNNSIFVLVLITPMPHDSKQAIVNVYKSAFFQDEANVNDQELYSSVIERTVSFLFYKIFFIDLFEKIVIYAAQNDIDLHKELKRYKMHLDGNMREHYKNKDFKIDADIYSLNSSEFFQRSTALIAFRDDYFVISATQYAVFELSIIGEEDLRSDTLKQILLTHNTSSEDYEPIDVYFEENAYEGLIEGVKQVCEYLSGKRKEFDLKIEIFESTDFQKKIWLQTMKIPYGNTVSYEYISKSISKENKNPGVLNRAVGGALGKNPLLLVVPCHRVIGKDGKLRGFTGGLDVKDYLLTHELKHFGLE